MASYNRYIGNTGRVVRVETPDEEHAHMQNHPHSEPQQTHHQQPIQQPMQPMQPMRRPQNQRPPASGPLGMLDSLQDKLSGILPRVLPDGLEMEDLLLLLILYLMYKESGDKELLIIMGGLFFL